MNSVFMFRLLALACATRDQEATTLDSASLLQTRAKQGLGGQQMAELLQHNVEQLRREYLRGPNVPPQPMMNSSAIELLSHELDKAKSYMEWGSGGSTVFAAKKENIIRMRTWENDEAWVDELKKDPVIQGAINNKLKLVYVNTGPIVPFGYPVNDDSKASWPSYSEYPAGEQFDLILVDGRYRVACFLKSVRDAPRPVALMMHDYSRQPYHVVEQFADKVNESGSLALFAPHSIDTLDMDKLDATIAKYEFEAGP